MITKIEAQGWLVGDDEVAIFTDIQNKILKCRIDNIEDDMICEKLHITRSVLERNEEDMLEQMDVPF